MRPVRPRRLPAPSLVPSTARRSRPLTRTRRAARTKPSCASPSARCAWSFVGVGWGELTRLHPCPPHPGQVPRSSAGQSRVALDSHPPGASTRLDHFPERRWASRKALTFLPPCSTSGAQRAAGPADGQVQPRGATAISTSRRLAHWCAAAAALPSSRSMLNAGLTSNCPFALRPSSCSRPQAHSTRPAHHSTRLPAGQHGRRTRPVQTGPARSGVWCASCLFLPRIPAVADRLGTLPVE